MSNLIAVGKPNQAVKCGSCGYEFPQDPPFSVECPACHAKAGQYCKRPSGHQGPFVPFHAERDLAALAAGFYDHCILNTSKPCGRQSTDQVKPGMPREAQLCLF